MLRLLASPLFIDLIGKRVCVACLFICVLVYVIFVCLEPVEVISVQCVPKILAKIIGQVWVCISNIIYSIVSSTKLRINQTMLVQL